MQRLRNYLGSVFYDTLDEEYPRLNFSTRTCDNESFPTLFRLHSNELAGQVEL